MSPVTIAAGLFLLVWPLLNRGKLPGHIAGRATRWVVQPMTRSLSNPTLTAFAGLGFPNGLLPCGFVYVALTGAITTENALVGAVYMTLYGLGTVPALLLVRFVPTLFPVTLRKRITLAMPIITVGLALLLLARGLYSATVIDRMGQVVPVCHTGQSAILRATR